MNNKCFLVLCLLNVVLLSSIHADISHATEAVVKANNSFAMNLYGKLKDRDGNLFLSPYSISTALAMTHAGARGQTARQMADVLQFFEEPKTSTIDSKKDEHETQNIKYMSTGQLAGAFAQLQRLLKANPTKQGYELSVANALWGQKDYKFLDAYLDIIEFGYDGQLSEVDFLRNPQAACKTINDWVEEETNGKITELIKPNILNAYTRLILTNAIYFKGDWASKFNEDLTKSEPFTLNDGSEIKVQMMNQQEKFKYAETDTFQILELPYVGSDLSMIVILPFEDDGISSLENTLTAELLSQKINIMQEFDVIVSIPKFKMTTMFSLSEVLQSMGMIDAFKYPDADFSGINGGNELFISAVVHKAFIEVNEKGTEATAATGVVIATRSVQPNRPIIFNADHPFLFLIQDNRTESILFMGRVMNPE